MTANTLQRLRDPWLVREPTFASIAEITKARTALPDEYEEPEKGAEYREGGVAVVHLKGAMMRNPSAFERAWFGATDTDLFAVAVADVAGDPSVASIVLDIDSPGGAVGGVKEAATAVRKAAAEKPVVAYTGGLMASAAYWVGSQADLIVANESARLGSIGVYLPFVDVSRALDQHGVRVDIVRNKEGTYKGAGFFGTALTDEQRGQMQSEVQELFDDFAAAVRAGRPDVTDKAMQGQTFTVRKSLEHGLLDVAGTEADAVLLAQAEARRRG